MTLRTVSNHGLRDERKNVGVVGFWVLVLALLAGVLPGAAGAQTFKALPALAFNKVFAGGNPQAQVISVASTGAAISFTAAVVNGTGGGWLSISQGTGCCGLTPQALTVTATPDISLGAGTYTAQIILKSQDGTQVLTVPVSLTVFAPSATFFDSTSGALTFSMATAGTAPPVKELPIRNGGAGTLAWTATVSTSDGGHWLTLSAASGSAPGMIEVGVVPGNLPSYGLVAGTFTGQVVLATSGDTVTIPVTFTVGTSVFAQLNPLFFTKPFQGGDPVPQVVTVASTGAAISFTAAVVNSTGGNWLTVSQGTGCCGVTAQAITVSVNPAVTLAAGTYGAEIILKSQSGSESSVVPVSLTISPPTAAFFNVLPGELTYSLATGGSAPPAQAFQILNAGTGTLNWTAAATTADGGGWLSLSAASGSAPGMLSVAIDPTQLPNGGLSAGTFVGQVMLRAGSDVVTVPVTVVVGNSVFRQVNGLSFTKGFQGSDPPAQVVTVASTGAAISFTASAVTSTGGNWLSISQGTGCCAVTPQAITVSANPAVTLAAGTYFGEIILKSQDGSQGSVVQVSLTVGGPTAAFFDVLPGQLSYSLATRGSAPPAQAFQIRNAGAGSLNWTATASTADSGSWLTLSAAGGSAPSNLSVGIVPANLPGGGLSAGTFTGQVVLQTAGDSVTIPVTVTVGTSVFQQLQALSFTKAYAGANPLPQVISVASTGAAFSFTAAVVDASGGSWLSVSQGTGCCGVTSQALTVTANPAVALAAGTYGAEIVLKSQDGSQSAVVPVTLVVGAPSQAFFDDEPGAITFSAQTASVTALTQAVPIRNAGAGTLNWTATVTTADGGPWLTVSAANGTAPSSLVVTVDPSNLPSSGLIAGTFTGQVVLQSGTDSVTIPVTMTLGTSVFKQLTPLTFTKAFQGATPATQTIAVMSTSAAISYTAVAVNSTGGGWLSINQGTGCCAVTPTTITVTANPLVSLATGVYSAEIIFKKQDGSEASVVPVTLNVGVVTPPAVVPVFTPAGGTYTAAQSVVITDATAGAAIYYTTDGSVPTANSTLYTGPIAVSAGVTIKAVAIASGSAASSVAVATYSFVPVTVSPNVVGFGSQAVGSTSGLRTVMVTNPGANALSGISVSLFGLNAADFGLDASACGGTLAAGGSCAVLLNYTPHAGGASVATVNIGYGGVGSPVSVALSGTGTTVAVALSISSVAAATVQTSQTVTVRAVDGAGNVVPGFTGTVTLTSSDGTAVILPATHTFTASDAGVYAFTVAFGTAGTYSVSASGSGLAGLQAGIAALDAVWVLGTNDQLKRLTAAGVVTVSTPGSGGSSALGAVAFDHAGNVWATETDLSLVAKYTATGVAVALPGVAAAGVTQPVALALDGLGQVWIANGTGSVSVLSNAGVAVSPGTGYLPGALAGPTGVMVDSAGAVWITNGTASTVTKIFGAAAPVVAPTVTGTTNNTLATRP